MSRARTRAQLNLHVLGETLGFLCMLFFILLCSAILAPFDCVSHPNGASTMRLPSDVLCNLKDDHLSLSLSAALLTLLPIAFVSICTYIVFIELPKRIRQMDVRFIRSCSFLFFRFRPGTEGFSIFLLIRNVIVAMAPVLPSTAAACFVVLCVLCGKLCLSAMLQPWLFSFATYVDLLTNFMLPRHPFPGCLFSGKLSGSVWYDFARNHPVWHFAALAGPVCVCIGKALVSKASKRVSFLLDPSQRGLWQYGSIDQSGASATEVLSVSGYRRSLFPHASLCYPESKCQDFAAHCFAQHSDPQVVCGRNHHGQHPEGGHLCYCIARLPLSR